MDERKQINFTIVPDDKGDAPRVYANFCAISHTPFDFTLSFCEVLPLSESDIQQAQAKHVVRAPVRAKIAVPAPGRAQPDRRAPGAHAGLQRVHRRQLGQGAGSLGARAVAGPMSLRARPTSS